MFRKVCEMQLYPHTYLAAEEDTETGRKCLVLYRVDDAGYIVEAHIFEGGHDWAVRVDKEEAHK